MNPKEINELIGLLLTVVAGTVITTFLSWKFLDALIDIIIKELKQGKKLAAFLTTLTVAGMAMLLVAVFAGVWLGYRYVRPEVANSESPKPAEPQATPAPTPTPHGTPGAKSAFKGRIRSGRQPQPPAAETIQTADAPVTPQTSQAPNAAPPAQSTPPQTPARETLPSFMTQPSAPSCNPAPPATTIIPPGEKSPEPDQLV